MVYNQQILPSELEVSSQQTFTRLVIVLSMYMLFFNRKENCVRMFSFVYMCIAVWDINRKGRDRVGIPVTALIPPIFCVWPKPEFRIPTSYAVFSNVQWFEIRCDAGFVNNGSIVDKHCS